GWNAHGRDEFALNQAYATRLGVPNPPQFAAWQDAVRPLNTMQRRLHNTPHGTSAVIMPMLWGDTLQAMAAKGPASPRMPDAATLANLLEQCDQAMQSATASGVAYLSEHTLFLKTYFRSVRQLSSLHEIVMQTAPKADRPALERETTKLLGLLTSSLGHLKQAAALRERDPEKGTARFRRFIEETKTELGACLR
ncbi:MAG: hypothetical protein HON70_16825, partial [Lentisphaerae bacterium]|nr:hypothetical protein [Lentisphaerota bacterium]